MTRCNLPNLVFRQYVYRKYETFVKEVSDKSDYVSNSLQNAHIIHSLKNIVKHNETEGYSEPSDVNFSSDSSPGAKTIDICMFQSIRVLSEGKYCRKANFLFNIYYNIHIKIFVGCSHSIFNNSRYLSQSIIKKLTTCLQRWTTFILQMQVPRRLSFPVFIITVISYGFLFLGFVVVKQSSYICISASFSLAIP